MTDQNNKNEDFLKNLIKKGNIEEAPIGFSDRVMAAIEIEQQTIKIEWWFRNSTWMWGSIMMGMASLIVVIFMIDFSFMGNILNGIELDGSRITQLVKYLGTGITSIIEGFRISSVTISVVVAFVALFVVDRLLRRKPSVEMHIL